MSRNTGPTDAVRALVFERDLSSCVCCGDEDGPFQLQHRRARGAGGSRAEDTNQPQNLCTLAENCHAAVEAYPVHSLERGYRVRQGHDPAAVPLLWHGRWVLLTVEGTVEDVQEESA